VAEDGVREFTKGFVAMMKYLLLCLLMFFGSMTLAAENGQPVDIGAFDTALSHALDGVLTCNSPMAPSTNGASGQMSKELGQMLWLLWARGGYYRDYIDPLITAVRNSVDNGQKSVDVTAFATYKNLIEMTEKDDAFVNCPQNADAFIEAVLLRAEAEAAR
jgi:hypothetical protein